MARPFRYTLIVGLVALGAALSAVGGWRYARASAPVSGPIVLLSIDALRADRLPVYGYAGLRTPAIDALARDGVVFERAYAHVPQTLPAHASLLTGRLPTETGIRDNAGFALKPADRLLAEMLADRGYATAAVVSSPALREATGIAQGFAFFDADMPTPEPGAAAIDPARDGAESVAIAEGWLEDAGTERAFLFLHLHDPHSPGAPPARFAAYGPYDGKVAYVDELVERFVKYLKAHQLYDQSTIILLADHGQGLGDHGERQHGVLAYEEAVRVPLIIKPAAGEGAGRRIDALVQHIDIVPTILDLAKAPIDDRLPGRSLKGLLEGSGEAPDRVAYAESLFTAYRFGWTGVRTVTDGRYRLVRSQRDELFDLAEDPGATRDLAAARPAELARLRAALDRIVAADVVPAPSPEPPEVMEQLAALGFAGPMAAVDSDAGEPVDPADEIAIVEAFRGAVRQALAGALPAAMQQIEALLRRHPQLGAVWHQLGDVAAAAGRFDRAAEAYRRAATLRPGQPGDHLAAAAALLRLKRLDDAVQQAELALGAAADRPTRAAAHELMARVALTRRDAAAARSHAALARESDPGSTLPAYVDGRLLYDAGRYEEALPLFESAIAGLARPGATPIAELHYAAADTLLRLHRAAEAEHHLLEELRAFPRNVRAHGALAALYHEGGRSDEAGAALAAMIRLSPTPEAYGLAARLWTSFGNPAQAAAVRSEAARAATPQKALPAGH